MNDFFNVLRCCGCDRVTIRKQLRNREGFSNQDFSAVECRSCGYSGMVALTCVGTLNKARMVARLHDSPGN